MTLALQTVTCIVQFWAVCAMTRVARGWRVTGAAFALYSLVEIAYDWGCVKIGLSPETALQLRFVVLWPLFTLLIVALSRDHLGRRIFLALDYGAYSVAFLPLSQVLSLWKPSVFAGGVHYSRLSSSLWRMRFSFSSCCRWCRIRIDAFPGGSFRWHPS